MIAVIGAGPAGLMAAERLAASGHGVTLYDRMPTPARKFLMAGRGGLNLTHSEPLPAFVARYGPAAARLEPAIRAFPPDALRDWCAGLGEPTFVGSSGRVFPRSFKASPLLRAWLRRLASTGVTVAARHDWRGWDDAGRLVFDTPGGAVAVAAAAVVLALGGASWPRLGGDGGWIAPLTAAGIAVRPLRPANCGFVVPWSPIFSQRHQGQPLKRIALHHGNRLARGEAMITADGIEGGAVYALSAPLREAIAAAGAAALTIDLRPDHRIADLTARLDKPRRGQSLSSFLKKTLALDPVAIGLLHEAAGRRPPESAAALAALIKAVPLRLVAAKPLARAISSAGGIAWDEVDDRFMLRRRPGVFAAGEMLDWEAPTGGYLLQACFATAVAAAAGVDCWLASRLKPDPADR